MVMTVVGEELNNSICKLSAQSGSGYPANGQTTPAFFVYPARRHLDSTNNHASIHLLKIEEKSTIARDSTKTN